MAYLLDANLLIALCDADHVHHKAAKHWFNKKSIDGWATCPITENAMLRIMGNPHYPGGNGKPEVIRPLLQHLRTLPGHQFWADTISLADTEHIPNLKYLSSKQLTDAYLLALAIHNKGKFATLDTRIEAKHITGGLKAIENIPTAV